MSDHKIEALVRIYEALGDEKHLDQIGQRLWDTADYPVLMIKICGEDIFNFEQIASWVFQFETCEENALLFKVACPSSRIIELIPPKRFKASDIVFNS